MKKLFFLSMALLLSGGLVFPQQKVWSLEECIKYAIDNNIQIKQQVIQTQYQQNVLDLAKLKLLPTLNSQASHNYSFGRALDQTTYQYTEHQNVQSSNFYAGGNMSLFKGLQNYNSIQKSKYDLLSSSEDLTTIKDNIALTVALDYLQILLNKELVLSTTDQVNITKQQIEKTRKMVDAGSVARGNLLQIESQAAQEELQLINLQNQLDISYLNISQLLELKSPAGFEISVPVIQVDTNSVVDGNVDGIFETAVGTRSEVKSSEYKLESSQYGLKIARGSRSPQLSLSHSISSGYSSIRKKLLGYDISTGTPVPQYGPYSFLDQVNDNVSYGVGFSLSIPILNGWQVNKNISNSKLDIRNSEYALEATKKTLYKNIQQAYADALASLKKYGASVKAVASAEESFRYTEQKFNMGMVAPVDYNAAKTTLLRAKSDLSQAKYEFIFKTKVLDFYKGLPLNLNVNK